MKTFSLCLTGVFLLVSCNNQHDADSGAQTTNRQISKPGTLIAADSMLIPDELNELYFTVKLLTTEHTDKGTYDINVNYGHNDASTQITMPEGGDKTIVPVLRRAPEPFTYIIGFRYGEDTTFYEYFLVKAQDNKTELKYLKAYSFQ